MTKRYVYFCSSIDYPGLNYLLLFKEFHRAQLDGINIFESKEVAINKAIKSLKKARKKYSSKYVDQIHIYECDTKTINSLGRCKFKEVAAVTEEGEILSY